MMTEDTQSSSLHLALLALCGLLIATKLYAPALRAVQTFLGRFHLHRVLVAHRRMTNAGDQEILCKGTVTGLFVYPGTWSNVEF